MDIKRKYYRVEPGSPAHLAVEEWQGLYRAARREWSEFEKRHGLKGLIREGGAVTGVAFENDAAPKGWRFKETVTGESGERIKGYVPDMRSKAGKALRHEMDTLPRIPDSNALEKLLGLPGFMVVGNSGSGMAIVHVGMEHLDGHYVLSFPESPCDPLPLPIGCTELAMSEYWALRERADKAA